jgi:hypothetical protein
MLLIFNDAGGGGGIFSHFVSLLSLAHFPVLVFFSFLSPFLRFLCSKLDVNVLPVTCQGHLSVRLQRGQPGAGPDGGDPGRGGPAPALHQGGAGHLSDDHQVNLVQVHNE